MDPATLADLERNRLDETPEPTVAPPRPRALAAAEPPRVLRAGRPMFLRWVVLQSVVITLLAAAALAYGGRLHGARLVRVPVILAVFAGASGYAGLLAWRLDGGLPTDGGVRHLWFAAGCCQLLGLLGTVAGFYAMFNDTGRRLGGEQRPRGPRDARRQCRPLVDLRRDPLLDRDPARAPRARPRGVTCDAVRCRRSRRSTS
jgi:hypothetical protein